MKHLFFFGLIKIAISQNIAYEMFQEYVKSPAGCIFNIKLKQSYFDETLVFNGVFYKKAEIYIFDTPKQFVKYENQYITTINKLNKQVVYDSMKKDYATIFDILSGNKQNIFFHPFVEKIERFTIPFEIELWGIKGTISIDKIDGSPKKISFTQDEDIEVNIDIVSSKNDSVVNLPTYDIMGYEVINLIE
tara:strand:- start:149 stop:718 length:570 start_codon:yes stop_codon:yes gene_type:complete